MKQRHINDKQYEKIEEDIRGRVNDLAKISSNLRRKKKREFNFPSQTSEGLRNCKYKLHLKRTKGVRAETGELLENLFKSNQIFT